MGTLSHSLFVRLIGRYGPPIALVVHSLDLP